MKKGNLKTLTKALEEAANGSWGDIENWASGNCSFTFNFFSESEPSEFDNNAFKMLVDSLSDVRILGHQKFSTLLVIFAYDWEEFSPEQKQVLFDRMHNFDLAALHSNSLFQLCELLGQYYKSAPSVSLLLQMNESGNEYLIFPALMGLSLILKHSDDNSLKRQSLRGLKSSARSENEAVSGEANSFVNKFYET